MESPGGQLEVELSLCKWLRKVQISRKMDEYSRHHTLHTSSKDEDTDERRHLEILQKHDESAIWSGARGAKIQQVGTSPLTLFHEQIKAVLNDNRKSNCLVTVDIEKLVSL